jgi:hypothetical protein
VLTLLSGCTSFRLADHRAPLLEVIKHRRASDSACAVLSFDSALEGGGSLSPADVSRWQKLLAQGLDRSNIFAEVVAAPGHTVPLEVDYVVDGEITEFNFQKNWVPTFFPGHVGLSLFTMSLYTWFAGPTTVTDVDFAVRVDVKDARTGELLDSFTEYYEDVSTLNIYTDGAGNPYQNPSLVFTQVINDVATKIAAALPE